ncbi:hypothetical protein PMAYCL1PPCAC_30800 [Pristionchus mayeri]|uniref:Snake toxin/toxin-like domain-containing protein n=1 Tax=Pristionchus mayeri TaxID=1317129 RepID=A0AAN5DDC6_9BILA|nr:hypothetical protein PMAYCL1PPCAC_30800 [Pristionchus mayeri]
MRSVILILLTVPVTISVYCEIGGTSEMPNGEEKEVYTHERCDTDYCYTVNVTNAGDERNYTISKGCGYDCKAEGRDEKTGFLCCKGDYCNAASDRSLLLTTVVVAVASWLWY